MITQTFTTFSRVTGTLKNVKFTKLACIPNIIEFVPQDDTEDLDDEGGKGKKGKGGGAAKKDLKVSDMDDWVDSEDGLDSDSDNENKKKKDSDDDDEVS